MKFIWIFYSMFIVLSVFLIIRHLKLTWNVSVLKENWGIIFQVRWYKFCIFFFIILLGSPNRMSLCLSSICGDSSSFFSRTRVSRVYHIIFPTNFKPTVSFIYFFIFYLKGFDLNSTVKLLLWKLLIALLLRRTSFPGSFP